jgi:hypothetical protein
MIKYDSKSHKEHVLASIKLKEKSLHFIQIYAPFNLRSPSPSPLIAPPFVVIVQSPSRCSSYEFSLCAHFQSLKYPVYILQPRLLFADLFPLGLEEKQAILEWKGMDKLMFV